MLYFWLATAGHRYCCAQRKCPVVAALKRIHTATKKSGLLYVSTKSNNRSSAIQQTMGRRKNPTWQLEKCVSAVCLLQLHIVTNKHSAWPEIASHALPTA